MTALSVRERSGSPAAVILSETKDLSQQSVFSHWWAAAGPSLLECSNEALRG
jgi:hypothetical protein